MADLVRVKINGKEYSVERNTTILDACRQVGIKIPTLCYLREITVSYTHLTLPTIRLV